MWPSSTHLHRLSHRFSHRVARFCVRCISVMLALQPASVRGEQSAAERAQTSIVADSASSATTTVVTQDLAAAPLVTGNNAIGRSVVGPASLAPQASQTMMWAQRDRWAVGVGVEQRGAVNVSTYQPATVSRRGLLVGLSLATSERSKLVFHLPVANKNMRLENDEAAMNGLPVQRLRMGLEFRPKDRFTDLRRNVLMKVELSSQTTVSLKPRGNRLGIALNSNW